MKILSNLKTKEKFIAGFIIGVIVAILYLIAVKVIHKTYGYDIESKTLLQVLIWLITYFAIFKFFLTLKTRKLIEFIFVLYLKIGLMAHKSVP